MSNSDRFGHFYSSTTSEKQRFNQLHLKQNVPLQKTIDLSNRVKDDKLYLEQVNEKYQSSGILYQRQPIEPELMIIKSSPYLPKAPTTPADKFKFNPFPIDIFAKVNKSTDKYSTNPFPIEINNMQPKIDKFITRGGAYDTSQCRPLKASIIAPKETSKVINLTKMSRDEFNKTLDSLGRTGGHSNQDRQHKHQKEMKEIEDFTKRIADKNQQLRGNQIVKEFIREELRFQPLEQIHKRKTGEERVNPSRRLSTYNQLMQDDRENLYGRIKTPVVEFNFLLKYLFLRSYHESEHEDGEKKVIPDRFATSEEYQAIFEYLFLNESFAQLKQELQSFLRERRTKYRKLQVKVDDTQQDKDGTILCVRAPQQHVVDQDHEAGSDNNCNLMMLRNYIVVLSHGLKLDITKFNCIGEPKSYIFGWLLEPQKATFLNQLRVLTFADPKHFRDWTDVVLIPFCKATTFVREFLMIRSLQLEDISSIIYDPMRQRHFISDASRGLQMNQNIIADPGVLTQFFETIRPRYNESQFQCIREISLIDRGVCLLQGPPGTGKTHTLIGLVSAIYNYMKKLGVIGERKILICAPSNAAIDEVLSRILREGIQNERGEIVRPRVLRIGPINNSDCHDTTQLNLHSLEEQAQKMLFEQQKFKATTDQRTTNDVRAELLKIKNQIQKQNKQTGDAQKELDVLYQQRNKLQQYLDEVKGIKRNQKENYTKHINFLLEKAEIICTTLASSGTDKLERFKGLIDVLIIDEAAQCTEPTNIIPLRLGVKKMILVGDPKQLPATTFSQISNETLYNRSLFERIIQNDFKPYFLNMQYRMHSSIRMFPSKQFYDDKLIDHPSIQQRQEHHTMALIDCTYGVEVRSESSFQNQAECDIILHLLKQYRCDHPNTTIGVVCGYKAQVKLIKYLFKTHHAELFNKDLLTINTIDSFQGQEKDVIIFSCVRSSNKRGVGFMSDQRRINVALTRAKFTLIVVGNCMTLSSDVCWKDYILDMIARQLYLGIHSESKMQEIVERLLDHQTQPQDKSPPTTLANLLMKESKGKHSKVVFNITDFTKDSIGKNKQDLHNRQDFKNNSNNNKTSFNNDRQDTNNRQDFKQDINNFEQESTINVKFKKEQRSEPRTHHIVGEQPQPIIISESPQTHPIIITSQPQSYEQMMKPQTVIKPNITCAEECETMDDLLQLICS